MRPGTNLPPQVLEALRQGRTIEAIRMLRESGNFGLAEAKSLIEWHARQNTIPARRPGGPGVARAPDAGVRPAAHARPLIHPTRASVSRALSPGEVPRTGSNAAGIGAMLVVAALVTLYLLG
jgi:hypothetical protein